MTRSGSRKKIETECLASNDLTDRTDQMPIRRKMPTGICDLQFLDGFIKLANSFRKSNAITRLHGLALAGSQISNRGSSA